MLRRARYGVHLLGSGGNSYGVGDPGIDLTPASPVCSPLLGTSLLRDLCILASSIAANTWTAAASFATYAATIVADGPYVYLRLNEAQPGNVATLPAANLGSLSTSQLYTRASTGTFAASFGLGASASANMTPTPNSSAQILKDGVCILPAAAQASLASPQTFTVEAWIKSTGAEGGKITRRSMGGGV